MRWITKIEKKNGDGSSGYCCSPRHKRASDKRSIGCNFQTSTQVSRNNTEHEEHMFYSINTKLEACKACNGQTLRQKNSIRSM